MASLRGWGILLIVIGVASWVLPLIGRQFPLILLPSALLGIPDYFSGIIFIVIGVILYFLGSKKSRTSQKAK